MSAKSECDPTRRSAWLQGGEWYGGRNLVGEFGAAVHGDFTQAAVQVVPGCAEGVRLPGYGLVHGYSEGVRDGPEHGAPYLPPLVQPTFVPKASRFLGMDFGIEIEVTQGDPAYPMIFNIFVDAVGRAVLEVCFGPQEPQHGMGWAEG